MSVTKQQAVDAILQNNIREPQQKEAQAWAATNIALCKYWGKRDDELNLPLTDSLSVMLPGYGVNCTLCISAVSAITPLDPAHKARGVGGDNYAPTTSQHHNPTTSRGSSAGSIIVNKETLGPESNAAKTLTHYLSLFLSTPWELKLDFNIPVAAGFASSAACYASIAKALNQLFAWQLDNTQLSALARLGSGSACRSIEPGFSHWQAGIDPLGTDSVAHALTNDWPDLCIGLYTLSNAPKPVSSREGMRRTRDTSLLFDAWPGQIEHDLPLLLQAIKEKDFQLLGETAEHNAMSMHATMESAWPPLVYTLAETRSLQQLIWDWRADGKVVYFTQDAGPNLKLIFEAKDADWLQQQLPELQIIQPFKDAP
jgi:diphosphomevalonate decarboxylase